MITKSVRITALFYGHYKRFGLFIITIIARDDCTYKTNKYPPLHHKVQMANFDNQFRLSFSFKGIKNKNYVYGDYFNMRL